MSVNPTGKTSWFNCCCCCIKRANDEPEPVMPEIRGFSPVKPDTPPTNEMPPPQQGFHTHNKSDWTESKEPEDGAFHYVPLS